MNLFIAFCRSNSTFSSMLKAIKKKKSFLFHSGCFSEALIAYIIITIAIKGMFGNLLYCICFRKNLYLKQGERYSEWGKSSHLAIKLCPHLVEQGYFLSRGSVSFTSWRTYGIFSMFIES